MLLRLWAEHIGIVVITQQCFTRRTDTARDDRVSHAGPGVSGLRTYLYPPQRIVGRERKRNETPHPDVRCAVASATKRPTSAGGPVGKRLAAAPLAFEGLSAPLVAT